MERAIDAIYENGVFRPVYRVRLAIAEGQRVRITVDDEGDPDILRLAASVYDGLSDSEITEIERIALDRRRFFGHRSDD
jgi:predicted DNA-binding antitoxin AbrB/MazE fold protein